MQELYGPNIPVAKLPSSDTFFYSIENLTKHDIIKYLEDENGMPRFKAVFNAGGGDVTGIVLHHAYGQKTMYT